MAMKGEHLCAEGLEEKPVSYDDQQRAEELSSKLRSDLNIQDTFINRTNLATNVKQENSNSCSTEFENNENCEECVERSETCSDDSEDCESNYESAEDDKIESWEDAIPSKEDAILSKEDGCWNDEPGENAENKQSIVVEEEEEEEIEEILTEEAKEIRRKEAQDLKEEGNSLFKDQKYEEAIICYTKAVKCCPKDFVKDRSIMYSNRAACRLRMDNVEEAIRDCTRALDLHPHYLKALLRRAELYEKKEKLDEALLDYQKVVEMDPGQHTARAACMRLPDQIKERNEKMKEEMLGKLKDLGNMILKPFGLSTNNFQMNQDPNTGGYSINFKQNA
ncbi:hypothetical protein FSP39_015344 [Pinctada imbricata]|uniref:Tetratricopeptide repeat protein 1 n=1 Tax=Pinctada imbricata TaxID=66713 RepID=A0AA88XZJ0_PINIB|nr:hypothetical protein FSP39_015344 [Pinctada imbricata]